MVYVITLSGFLSVENVIIIKRTRIHNPIPVIQSKYSLNNLFQVSFIHKTSQLFYILSMKQRKSNFLTPMFSDEVPQFKVQNLRTFSKRNENNNS